MYSLKNLWSKEPVAIAEAVRTVLFVAVLLNVLILESAQLAGIALVVSVVLSLFVRSNVTAPANK